MPDDDDLPMFQRMLLAFDTPAYIRRARQVEGEWRHLLAICQRERERQLELPRLRLAQLIVATDSLTAPAPFPLDAADRSQLLQQYLEWQPTLRTAVIRALLSSDVTALLQPWLTACQRFNARWEQFLTSLDLSPVNDLRDRYNRYYLLEKECAVRSSQTARDGFEPLVSATLADLQAAFPLLPLVPRRHD